MIFIPRHMNAFSTSLARLLAGGTLVLATSLVLPALAQPGSGGPTPGAVTTTPIDGGASLLLASGVALGLKQLRARRQARRTAK